MWRKFLIGAAFGLLAAGIANAAVSPLKTWTSGETLTASALNAEFLNVYNNGEDLAWPASKAKDFNGQVLQLDADQDTTLDAATDDRIDLALAGTDLFRFDGTAVTPINGLDFIASAASGDVQIAAVGGDTNINIDIVPKGSGTVQINGDQALTEIVTDTTPQLGGQLDVNGSGLGDGTLELLTFTETGSAVNHLNITNNATNNPPILGAAGDDTDIDFELRSKGAGDVVLADASGEEVVVAADVASAVNEITITNSATTDPVTIAATGDDSDIGINIDAKGGGDITFNSADGEMAKIVDVSSGVNFPQLEPSATGSPVKVSANGDDTNVGIELEVKGTEFVTAGGHRVGPMEFSGAVDLTSGAPTTVSLASSLDTVSLVEITIIDFSTNSANQAALIRLEDGGGIETTGYDGNVRASGTAESNSDGFLTIPNIFQDAATTYVGTVILRHMGSDIWTVETHGNAPGVNSSMSGAGSITLDDDLVAVHLTTTGGSATIDSGTAYVRWN